MKLLTREEATREGARLLAEDRFHYVVTPNPEFILAAEKDEAFRNILNEYADVVDLAQFTVIEKREEEAA